MLQSLSTSRLGMRMARGVGRLVPRRAADPIVRFAAGRMMADPDSALNQAVRANQWMVSGKTLHGAALDEAARANVRMMARFLYDFYHVLGNRAAEERLVVVDDTFRAFVERERSGGGPFVYVGAHFGNFDLVGRLLGRYGWHMQLLSVAGPNEGYQWQNAVRAEVGFDVTPVSMEALKKAARSLAEGRSVLSGLDRPLPRPDKVMPRFFGHPSPMPLMHVRLAMKARVPVVVISAPRDADGRYRLYASDPIEMLGEKPTPEALATNAERCLAPVERWVTESPAQWAMPHRAWPDLPVPD